MKCPYCSTSETKVVDSRLNQTGDITRRRRQCNHCDARFTTYERVEEMMPTIIKKDGRREPYIREKVMAGIVKSCEKRNITSEQIETTLNQIEKRIQSYGLKEIPSKAIGQMVMTGLHKLDKVAYVRFAAVYRDFKDVEEFVAELQEPPTTSEDPTNPNLTFPFLASDEGATSHDHKTPSA